MDNVVGKRIKDFRKKKGWSGAELSEKLQVAQPMISKYESGQKRPGIDTLCLLAKLSGSTVDYFLGLTDDPGQSLPPVTLAEFDKAINPEVPRNIRPEDSAISLLSLAYSALRAEYGNMPPSDKSAVEGLIKAFVLLLEEEKD